LYECIQQLKNNPKQRTIVLVEITFDLRKELWISSHNAPIAAADSNFYSVQLAKTADWWQQRFKKSFDKLDDIDQLNSLDKKYLKKWQQAEQYFYSPYAENINLIMDLINFTSFMKLHNIEYLIFRGNPAEPLEDEHVLDTFGNQLADDNNIFDLFNFSFTKWCVDNNYQPIDFVDQPYIGHPSLEAHNAFGLFLTEKLK